MDWGAVEIGLLVVGALLGAALCLVFLLVRARSASEHSTQVSVHDAEVFERSLGAELERARRHERPLTLVYIPWNASDGDGGRTVLGSITLRRIDRVFALHNGTFLIAPETGVQAKEALLARLRSACEPRAAATLRAATFPDDGLSSGALLARCDRPATARTPARRGAPRTPDPVTQTTTDRRRIA